MTPDFVHSDVEGDEKVTGRAKQLIESALSTVMSHTAKNSTFQESVQFSRGLVRTIVDKECILAGELDNHHIDLAQNMLKQQSSEKGRLQSNLVTDKAPEAAHREQQYRNPNCTFPWQTLDCSGNSACC